ncbi:hypothetical protein [Paractinoplanes maris]|uniref:hypothetical protein n=1 Tax=Paractinoplanes maris TaxID=1734446 RepID=UPI0020207E9B|nr:hypothetical protein [Actinoplanes maris]
MEVLVFFDIGGTLADVTVGPGPTIATMDVLPGVADVLRCLSDGGLRLGVLSDPGPIPTSEVDRALRDAGLGPFFDPGLVIYGSKSTPAIFHRAAAQSCPGARLVFVGENDGERARATEAGFDVRPSPAVALDLLDS